MSETDLPEPQPVQDTTLQTAMQSGSDAGEAGERHEPTTAGGDSPVAVEDSPEAVSAADDDSTLPALRPTGTAPDEMTPVFQEPVRGD